MDMRSEIVKSAFRKILDGGEVSLGEAVELSDCELEELCSAAGEIRRKFLGGNFSTCSIMNAKSGGCSENCKWCAQSAANRGMSAVYPLVSKEEAMRHFLRAKRWGIRRFSLVASGRKLSKADVEGAAEIFRALKNEGGVELCGSFGLLDFGSLKMLADAGMTRYHCNLESAPSKFPELCSTHTISDKLETISFARRAGLEICSGGIIGMGETRAQRAELAVAVREAGAVSVPVNVLQPIKGTPLENLQPLPNDEILRTFAVFRFANPKAHIRFAAGRLGFKEIERKAMMSGISGMLMGDMLTTVGSGVEGDFSTLREMGFDF